MATGILDCPSEVLYCILNFLETPDFYRLCLVSRDLRSLVEPVLYSKAQWTWQAPPIPRRKMTPPIIIFLRAIAARPELADFVQEINLDGDDLGRISHYSGSGKPMVPVSRLTLGDIVALVERLDVPFRDQWVRELRWGSLDTYVALLLALTPNLKRLRLNENFFRNSRFVGMYIRSVMCEEPTQQEASSARSQPLSNLSEVYARLTYQGKARIGSSNTSDILTVFYSRTIRHISASIDNPLTFSWPGEAPPTPTNLTSLELAVLREGHLGELLSVTKNLRKLKWEWLLTPKAKRPGVKDIIDLNQIAADLSHVRHSLTDLTITADIDDSWRNYDMELLEFRGSFAALADFDGLKDLEIPFPFLTASLTDEVTYPIQRSLPGTLRTLQITDDLLQQLDYEEGNHYPFHAISGGIRSWLGDCRINMPCLEKFRLLLRTADLEQEDWGSRIGTMVRDLGAREGIQAHIGKLERGLWFRAS